MEKSKLIDFLLSNEEKEETKRGQVADIKQLKQVD